MHVPTVGQCLAPGDWVCDLPETGVVRVGSGIVDDDGSSLRTTKAGIVQQQGQGKKVIWVLNQQKRYIPSAQDPVLGVVVNRYSDHYELDIGAPFLALLPVLAFDNATRRNRPNLKEGDAVYCRVDTAHRDLQPTVTCLTDGRSNETSAGLGPITDGFIVQCGTGVAKQLLSRPLPPSISSLVGKLPSGFELAVGLNGLVWIKSSAPSGSSDSLSTVILVKQALENAGRNNSYDHIVSSMLHKLST